MVPGCPLVLLLACSSEGGLAGTRTGGVLVGTRPPGASTSTGTVASSTVDGTTSSSGASGSTPATGATPPDSGTNPDEPPPLDLEEVVWLHEDVSGWDETAVLDPVYFSGDDICLPYDKADEWPEWKASPGDDPVVANPWVFIWYEGRWWGATWEWMRPGQVCKAASSVAGDHIKQAPFDEASGWRPASGELLYFMVSGLARLSERTVLERSNVQPVVWP